MFANYRTSLWHLWCLFGLAAFLVGIPLSATMAQSVLQSAPLNPAFLAYQQRQASATQTVGGHTLGYIPPPVSIYFPASTHAGTRVALPASYDLRTANPAKLSPIEDQGQSGCCWAFATYGSLESCLLPGSSLIFSENNLKNNSGFLPDPNTGGGDYFMSTAYLARWGYTTTTAFPYGAGPVLASQDPYNDTSTTSPNFAPALHVQQVIFLPPRESATDNTGIKNAVMTYGAVGTSIYASDGFADNTNDGYWNPTTSSYYYGKNAESDPTNHAVCIVGWNDNLRIDEFRQNSRGERRLHRAQQLGHRLGRCRIFLRLLL